MSKLRKVKRYSETDDRQTSIDLCQKIVDYFKPSGIILEPCKGDGNFLKVLPIDSEWCEIKENRNFFDYNNKVNWIITNPPWSLFGEFLKHSLEISNHIVFIAAFHYIGTKKRLKMLKDLQFWIKDILLVETPISWGGWGFQLVCFHFEKFYSGNTYIGYL